ncbi:MULTISPECIES: helix-turn-helix domain-containing protein [Brevibacterium]|uniref:DNA-binding protein n=2 Tax=Brevibacterium TaxID=1696 RepID=A0A2N6PF38_9MICO|nr:MULTISPECIES: helix-turn-helix domain-containing protein [Brevibacterium]MBD8021099.1 helix-turn-helix domain-containing protein [Brevibacterium gallinarum]MBM7529075.1 excisionase family DNA binding protein [Brevibacterium luteolum]MBU8578003.1 helix-turn-helix domain-containing protein [Brevibacterium luteolum]MCT1658026.1 helix-turn-helix domain-containing protein [Brevibacterium luteolum]MCT1689717.1 helix-turn-helix domain-containing protein [Brevibacterium sp. p3-SID960]
MVAEVRFLPLTDVAEILNVTVTQARALVRSGELRAIKVGGRGQWRIEKAELEDYIQRMYSQTQQEIREGRVDV